MTFQVQPVAFADAPLLARCMMTSYYTDSHWALMWTIPLAQIISDCEQRLPRNLARASDKRHQKAVDPATGDIVGYIRWEMSPNITLDWPEARAPVATPAELETFEAAYQSALVDGGMRGLRKEMLNSPEAHLLFTKQEEIVAGEPFLFVDYLTTYPPYKGRGVASLLLKQGLDVADESGLKVFVQSSQPARGLYEKHGFVVKGTVVHDDTRWGGEGTYTSWLMVREPRK